MSVDEDEITAFWRVARNRAHLSNMPGYLPATSLEMVAPPAWSFGSSPQQADELLALVLAGAKTATASAARDYASSGAPLPQVGELGILLDGEGHPRALIETTHVQIEGFDEVGEEHAQLEGEGDRSLAAWREVHERFFSEPPGSAEVIEPFSIDMDVVLERFRVIFPASS